MEMIGLVLMIVGLLAALVGGVWFLAIAFSESILWGLGCMFIPFVGLIFLVLNFGETWKPFVLNLVGSVMMFAGIAMNAGGTTP